MTSTVVQHAVRRVATWEMRKDLFYLARDPLPRRTLNHSLPGHEHSTLHEADKYIETRLRSWGYEVEHEIVDVQAFRRDETKPIAAQFAPPEPDDPWFEAHNLYAKRVGTADPGKIIVAIAHKDSQSWIASPGANDNAIGTVGLLQVAKALAAVPTCKSVWCLWCNEEHTPWTSVTAAEKARDRGDEIIAVFNLDGIGVKAPETTREGRMTNVTVYSTPEGKKLAELMEIMNERYGFRLEQSSAEQSPPGDDHGSFIKAGFPAAVLNIGSFPYADPNYHTEGDIPELTDVHNAAVAVKATIAAILTLSEESSG